MTGGTRAAVGSPTEAVAAAFAKIDDDPRPGIWIDLVDRRAALTAAAEVERRLDAGEYLPLAGLSVAVKGNIDVAGFVTTAGCPAFGHPVSESAPVVRAVERAGGVVVGVTNLDQFATGLVGTRSPFGVCPNARWPTLVSGGSSSGSAVVVAAGHVDVALGTDTAGSGRVPAALNGIVGLKPTRGAISRRGVVPACRSLDCVSVFARSVEQAAAVADALYTTSPDPDDPWTRKRPARPAVGKPTVPWRLGVADPGLLDFDGDPFGPTDHRLAVEAVCGFEADPLVVDIEPFLAVGRLLYEGAFLAERYSAVGEFIETHLDQVDPVVAGIITAGREVAGWEVFRDLERLEHLRRATESVWASIDMLALPTVPRVATSAEVAADPIGPNRMLGTYTNFVNLLDLCALTIPVEVGGSQRDGPPPSVTLIAPAWSEQRLVDLGHRVTTRAEV